MKAPLDGPEDLQAAVVLRDVQHFDNSEAAAILDISVSAFKARLHRGRIAVRNRIDQYVGGSGRGGT